MNFKTFHLVLSFNDINSKVNKVGNLEYKILSLPYNLNRSNMNTPKLMNRAADIIRILAASMVEKANSGHPGGAMGGDWCDWYGFRCDPRYYCSIKYQ